MSPPKLWWWRNVKIRSAPRLSPIGAHPLGSQGGGWREVSRPFPSHPIFRSTPLGQRSFSRSERRDSSKLPTHRDLEPRTGTADRFHRDYRHDTEECYDLKNQIEDLILRGHLNRYIMKLREPSLCLKGPVERHIDVIVGGLAMGGVSSSARKAYACAKVQKRPRP
ncbi:hypothetical protein B296_00000094 [Ensete ventricosum]|uniref:Uncharacterized protein n=1 Tax=Ensete ventricosum TaxID=4639 RepID=A0A427B2S8_ENSVE|nr:hypothetical protein B296_00000094 [Ensete ventricosum]